jgi:hypothetical protein
MPRNGSGGYTAPSNSFNPAINGVAATATDWNATLTDLAAAIQQSISADGQTPITGNLQMGGNKLTNLAAGSGTGQSLRYEQLFSQGTLTDIASAATLDIGAQLTNFLRVTGTTGVTSFGTNYNGPRFLIFSGAVLLTHSATLVLPTAANITTAAGDSLIAVPISGGWQVVAYQKADGSALSANLIAATTAGTSTAYTLTPSPAITAYAANQTFWVTFHTASGATPTITISGVATPPNLVKQDVTGAYVNIQAGDIPTNHRSRVTLISTTQALVEELPPTVNQIQPVTASVAGNALTVGLNPTVLEFRSTTLTTGVPNKRTVPTAISLIVPSTATLGTVSGILSRIAIVAIDNAGTVELAVINADGAASLNEAGLINTTAISGAATSGSVFYSNTARSNVPYRVVGYVTSTQATAGTWASTPTLVQGAGGTPVDARLTLGTIVNTTSGTAIDFTGLPSWVKRVTLLLNRVSTSGTSNMLVQLGAGSVQNTGYLSNANNPTNPIATSTAGFLVTGYTVAANAQSGRITFETLGSNVWVSSGISAFDAANNSSFSGGSVTLSGTIDRLRFTTVNGTDTFDAGSVNILYEG